MTSKVMNSRFFMSWSLNHRTVEVPTVFPTPEGGSLVEIGYFDRDRSTLPSGLLIVSTRTLMASPSR
jgi:hypothetical protein